MAIATIPQRAMSEQGFSFRNLIINGDMSIAQRGTSVAGLTNGSSQYLIDRFRWYEGGSPTYQFTMSQDTNVPTGQGFAKSLKLACTTAQSSLGADDSNILYQRIEAQSLQHLKFGTSNAESLTLSFWVKSNKTGTYIIELYSPDGNRGISKSYTISSVDTWEKKTITYVGDTSGTINNDNGAGLDVYFFLSAGSNYQSGTLGTSWHVYSSAVEAVGQVNLADTVSNYWQVTGVQLEVGTSASDFEFLPYDVNLQRCKRYYQTLHQITGVASGSTDWRGIAGLYPEMRATVSLSATGNIEISDCYAADLTSTGTSVNVINNTGSNKRVFLQMTSFSGMTSGRIYFANRYHTNDNYIEADAEL